MKRIMILTLLVLATIVSTTLSGQVAQAKNNSGDCLDPKDPRSFTATISTRTSGTIATKGGRPLCSDATMVMQSFNIPETWDGKGWNKTAIPQTSFAKKEFTFPGNKSDYKMTVTVDAPDECKNTQTDFYTEAGYDRIDTLTGDDERNVIGVLFKGTGKCEEPTPEPEPEPTPEPEMIEVCRLSDKKYPVSIDEKDFDESIYSKDSSDCDKEVTPTPETPETPEVTPEETPEVSKEVPAELPKTGIGSTIGGLIGLGSLTATGYEYIRSRKYRQ